MLVGREVEWSLLSIDNTPYLISCSSSFHCHCRLHMVKKRVVENGEESTSKKKKKGDPTPECTCGSCLDGWLSPRMMYRLKSATEVLTLLVYHTSSHIISYHILISFLIINTNFSEVFILMIYIRLPKTSLEQILIKSKLHQVHFLSITLLLYFISSLSSIL